MMTYPEFSTKEGVKPIEFTRENLQALHEGLGVSGQYVGVMLPDSEIAHLFGCSEWEASCARKRASYWEGKPEKAKIEHDNGQNDTPKFKKKKAE